MQEKIHYPLQSKNWTINTFSYPWELKLLNDGGDYFQNPDVLVVSSTTTQYEALRLALKNGGDISGLTSDDINKFHVLSIANRYVYEEYEKIKNKKEFLYPKAFTGSIFQNQNIYNFLDHSGDAGNITVIQIPWQMRGHRIKRGSIKFNYCFLTSYESSEYGNVPLIYDDELGNLILSDPVKDYEFTVGHVDYDQGLILVWDLSWNYSTGLAECTFNWSSDLEVTTFECLVNAKTNMLFSSLNKTWKNMLDANSDVNNNLPTGWDPFPHFTTIGLYNDAGELLMVAKLANSIKRTNTIDQLIHIRHDF